MENSAFQFSNPALVGLEFNLNEEYRNEESEEINININLSVSVERLEHENTAKVTLKLQLCENSKNVPFYISASEAAYFSWEESLEEKRIEKLLNQNAPSLLLSYIRPVITQITAASPFEAYNIPFINFTNQ